MDNHDPGYFMVKASVRSVEGALKRFYNQDPYYSTAEWSHDAVTIRRDDDTGETEASVDTGGDLRTILFAYLRGYYTGFANRHPWRFRSW